MASVAGRTRRCGWASIAGFVVLVVLALSLLSGSASAQKPQPVAKVAPGVYMSKISAQATGIFGHQGSFWVSGYSPRSRGSPRLLFTRTFTP